MFDRMRARLGGLAVLLAISSASVHAGDWVKGDRVILLPGKGDTFETGAYRLGAYDLLGYIGDLKDRKKIRAMELREGAKATKRQREALTHIAQEHHLEAYIELNGVDQALVIGDIASPMATPSR